MLLKSLRIPLWKIRTRKERIFIHFLFLYSFWGRYFFYDNDIVEIGTRKERWINMESVIEIVDKTIKSKLGEKGYFFIWENITKGKLFFHLRKNNHFFLYSFLRSKCINHCAKSRLGSKLTFSFFFYFRIILKKILYNFKKDIVFL